MIEIKNTTVLKALLTKTYHPILVDIVVYVASIVPNIVITEGWRKGGGVHSMIPCRGLDLRSWIYFETKLKEIQSKVNSKWTYDLKRPTMECCIIHDVGKGRHIHLQVHPNTVEV